MLQNGQYPSLEAQKLSGSVRNYYGESLVARTDDESSGQSSNVGRLAMHMVGNRAAQTLQHSCCASGLLARKSTVCTAVQGTQECLIASPRCQWTPAPCNPECAPIDVPKRVLKAAALSTPFVEIVGLKQALACSTYT